MRILWTPLMHETLLHIVLVHMKPVSVLMWHVTWTEDSSFVTHNNVPTAVPLITVVVKTQVTDLFSVLIIIYQYSKLVMTEHYTDVVQQRVQH